MSATATVAEERDDTFVSQPEAKLLFMARRDELRLTWQSRYPTYGPGGQKTGVTPGKYVGFKDGVFRCPEEGTFTLVDTLDGGEMDVDAAELVAWLRSHRLHLDRQEGFWEVDPVAPAPSPQEMKTLIRLAQLADVPALESYIAQERAGWNRADLLEAAEEALETSRAALAELEAQPQGGPPAGGAA